MPDSFVERLAKTADLEPTEIAVLTNSGIQSYDDLYSLVHCFPSISKANVRLNVLSNLASQGIGRSSSFAKSAGRMASSAPSVPLKHGASHPPKAHWDLGDSVPVPFSKTTSGAPGPASPPGPPGPPGGPTSPRIDVRTPNWPGPVGDQGDRGTCVAFAAAACAEYRRVAPFPSQTIDLSEQFLFWAIKNRTSDRNSQQEGTRLEFARDALDPTGVCTETFWPYNPQPIAGTFCQDGHGGPSGPALIDASSNTFRPLNYMVFQGPGTGAAAVLAALQRAHPVGVTLPVYGDPYDDTKPDNWSTVSGFTYGRVLDPPTISVVRSGHAVCITGYEPDPMERLGGYFVFRNSWGINWAARAPTSPGYSPAPGYGYISATYVNNFLWELLEL